MRWSLRRRGIALGAFTVVAALALSVSVGAVSIPIGNVVREFLSHLPGLGIRSPLGETDRNVVWQFRLPRAVLGALVGATLSLAGSAYQGAFRNPLVDPYLLGSAAGAGLGATIVLVYLPSLRDWPIDPLPLAAFIGALSAVALSYGVARSADSGPSSLVLAGVAVASLLTAMQTFAQQRKQEVLRTVYSWILGGLTTSGWRSVLLILPYVAICSLVLFRYRVLLDALSVGDVEAASLGLSPTRVRTIVVIAASLGTAAAVAVSGLIGFVGLVVPHAVRLVFGVTHRVVLPVSALFGAAFLMLADVGARTVLAPVELPIGVVTAFAGAPFFAFLLSRRSSSTL